MIETKTLSVTPPDLKEAAEILHNGGLVAFPTETVYGLGADACSNRAVARIFQAKGRPSFNPLIAHVADIRMARAFAHFDDIALRLAAAFWPGPLTLVLPLRENSGMSPLASAGLNTIGLRVPEHRAAQMLLEEFGGPIAAPSANRSGQISPTTAAHVLAGLTGRIEAVLDDGPCPVGLESTIIGFEGGATLLRAGGLPMEVIESCLGKPLRFISKTDPVTAPGQLASHYAPNARVRLNATRKNEGEMLLGFGSVEGADLNLSPSHDMVEAAANLFGYLHQLDAMGAKTIAVSAIPETGLGRAINDRLRRAAAPRP